MLHPLIHMLVKVVVASLIVGTILAHFGITAEHIGKEFGLSYERIEDLASEVSEVPGVETEDLAATVSIPVPGRKSKRAPKAVFVDGLTGAPESASTGPIRVEAPAVHPDTVDEREARRARRRELFASR